MVTRIEIYSKVEDTQALVLEKKLQAEFPGIKVLLLADIYTIEKEFSSKQLKQIGSLFTNPVSQKYKVSSHLAPVKFNFAIEIGFLPGVTDNIASTAKEIIEDHFRNKFRGSEGLYTSKLLFIRGNFSNAKLKNLLNSLYNPLIQRVHIKTSKQFMKDRGMEKIVPRVKLGKKPQVSQVNLNVSDEELEKIGKEGIKNTDGSRRGPLALDLVYIKAIQNHFNKINRNPTDIELESLAQTWSEHCKHTIFADPIDEIKNGLFNTYIKDATEKIRKKLGKNDFCVSVFEDNSGAIEFDKNFLVTHKVETHNTPSALDPFGGAITGIVGVNRDALGFGLGAKPLANCYGFCFAPPDDDSPIFKDLNLTQKMLTPRRILDGVVAGINSGGNQSGIPTPQGFIFFDKSYKGKPLVFCGTLGLIPKRIGKRLSHIKRAQEGDLIVMVGGRVGLDGIHGATFSSEALTSGSPSSAVQIGDPITQKKFSDAIVREARDLNLYSSITDNGAGGLSCSVSEMARESGGCLVELNKVPLKYPGLDPWQIWISESQERMTLAVPKKKLKKLLDLMTKRGVEATVIGKFTNSKSCQVKYQDKIIMDIELDFLHNGLPKRHLITKKPRLLKRPIKKDPLNNSSFEFISIQYDHEVQASSVLKPLQGIGRVNSDFSIIKPVLDSSKGVVISQSLYPELTEVNPYLMAGYCIDEAIKNLITAGADMQKIALLDNFCWSTSNDPERLWLLKEALRGCFDFATFFNTPFISGKDSMYNDFYGFNEKGNSIKISALPTLLISSIGIVEDVNKSVSIDPKFEGDLIYLLGESVKKDLPSLNLKLNKKIYQNYSKAVKEELISSAIPVNRGGMLFAVNKMFISGKLGMDISIDDPYFLNSESPGRIILTINPSNEKQFENLFKDLPFIQIGVTNQTSFLNIKNRKGLISKNYSTLEKEYKERFKNF